MLVAVSAAAGGRLLASADDTVTVWAAAHDLPSGSVLTASDVTSADVHFDTGSTGAGYVIATTPIAGQRLTEPLGQGELVPAHAVEASTASSPQLPLGVAASDLPRDLGAGDRVDLWAVSGGRGEAADGRGVTRILAGVAVVSVTEPEIASASGDRQVLLAVESGPDVAAVLAALADARPVLVRVGG